MQLLNEPLKQEILVAISGMEGWCSNEKALAMAELILEQRPKLIVELGVFGGKSLVPQAIALRATGVDGLIIGIDPWKKDAALEGDNGPDNDAWWSNVDLHHIHRRCIEEVWNNDLDRWCVVIRAKNDRCLRLADNYGIDNIDILHIDANHSEITSCNDVINWVPRVRSGGYVWIDDADWPSTAKARELMLNYATLVKEIKSNNLCQLYQKK